MEWTDGRFGGTIARHGRVIIKCRRIDKRGYSDLDPTDV